MHPDEHEETDPAAQPRLGFGARTAAPPPRPPVTAIPAPAPPSNLRPPQKHYRDCFEEQMRCQHHCDDSYNCFSRCAGSNDAKEAQCREICEQGRSVCKSQCEGA